LEYFAVHRVRKDGRQPYCRECKSGFDSRYYHANKTTHYQRVSRYIRDNKLKLWDYLVNHPCVDCGQDDPVVLEFDHLENKEAAVSNMISRRFSWQAIEREIRKCEVRCANCHRKRTAV